MVVPLTDGSATGEEREPTDDLACTAAALVVPAQGILATASARKIRRPFHDPEG